MAKSIRDIPKKRGRGRPRTTGRGEAIMLRLHPPLLTRLNEWIQAQEHHPSRPEAVRRLLEQALSNRDKGRPLRKGTAEKAAGLAAQAIDKTTDKSQSAEEQKTRKRRLIKGPSEFRDIRRDQQKTRI